MQPLPFTLTNESLTVVVDGAPRVLHKGTAQYEAVRAELLKDEPDWDAARRGLTQGGAVAAWLEKSGVEGFAVDAQGHIQYQGEYLPPEFQGRAAKMAAAGEDPSPLMRFFARLQQNPSKRSVDQLYTFLKHCNIPIEADGTFLAYKGVRSDLTDKHSGTIDNTPGKVIRMARNQISDDPREACHEGLHVGARRYAESFKGYDGKLLVVRVAPENVVCVPYDSSAEKMRVCEYEVVGFDTGPLPDTTVKNEDVVPEYDDEGDELEDEEVDLDGPEDSYSDDEVDENPSSSTYGQPLENPGPSAESAPKKRTPPKSVRSLARKTARELFKETIDSLRAYAGNLKIVGATRLPGGKARLVKEIEKARRRR